MKIHNINTIDPLSNQDYAVVQACNWVTDQFMVHLSGNRWAAAVELTGYNIRIHKHGNTFMNIGWPTVAFDLVAAIDVSPNSTDVTKLWVVVVEVPDGLAPIKVIPVHHSLLGESAMVVVSLAVMDEHNQCEYDPNVRAYTLEEENIKMIESGLVEIRHQPMEFGQSDEPLRVYNPKGMYYPAALYNHGSETFLIKNFKSPPRPGRAEGPVYSGMLGSSGDELPAKWGMPLTRQFMKMPETVEDEVFIKSSAGASQPTTRFSMDVPLFNPLKYESLSFIKDHPSRQALMDSMMKYNQAASALREFHLHELNDRAVSYAVTEVVRRMAVNHSIGKMPLSVTKADVEMYYPLALEQYQRALVSMADRIVDRVKLVDTFLNKNIPGTMVPDAIIFLDSFTKGVTLVHNAIMARSHASIAEYMAEMYMASAKVKNTDECWLTSVFFEAAK